MESVKDSDSTKLTYIIQVDLGGFIPSQVIGRSARRFFKDYSIMRKVFSMDYEKDLNTRMSIMDHMYKIELDKVELTTDERNDFQRAKVSESPHCVDCDLHRKPGEERSDE